MAAISVGLGQDCDIELTDDKGNTFSFSTASTDRWMGADLADFQADPINNVVTAKCLSNQGYDRYRTERSGWRGTITVNRLNGFVEGLEIQAHNDYHANIPETKYSIHSTIQNQDGTGSVSEYEFTNCVIGISKGANNRNGEVTQIALEFMGQACIDQAKGPLGV